MHTNHLQFVKLHIEFISGETKEINVTAVDEAGARQNYEVTELKDDTEYGFRLYSAADTRRSLASTLVVVRTAHKRQYHLVCHCFCNYYRNCHSSIN